MEENLNQSEQLIETHARFHFFPFFNKKQVGFFIFLLAVIFYSPSFNNEYALDDGIVIHQNSYVLKGVRGLKGILTKDAYDSFYRRMNASDQLQGGRYRPVAGISYALEQELLGTYRTGLYMCTSDINNNGVLDHDPVSGTNFAGQSETNYEFNDYVDVNKDGIAQVSECYNCWDLNKNFVNDPDEDVNIDGVFNEIDCQDYGSSLRHFTNILLYAICCLLIYLLFAKHFFPKQQDLALLAALLFTIHPIHSEVVANVRGRDDLLSMIFIVLCISTAFQYLDSKKNSKLIWSSVFAFLALMSKEYAICLFIILPLAIVVFRKEKIAFLSYLIPVLIFSASTIIMARIDYFRNYLLGNEALSYVVILAITLPVLLFAGRKLILEKSNISLIYGLSAVSLIYMGLRLNAVSMNPGVPDTEILNNPYLLASQGQAFATKVYFLLFALKLAILPHPLVADYSYNAVPYKDLTDPLFILSVLLHLSLLVLGIFLTVRKHVLGFAILTYLIFLLVVSNIIFPTHIMFLESNLFHASLGFSIALAWLIMKGITYLEKSSFSSARYAIMILVILLIIPSAMKSWERSKDWKNDVTLFLKDVNNSPNSVLILGNAGARWIDLADTKEITGVLIPGQDNSRFNDYNGTLKITDEELRLGGYKTKREAALNKGIGYLKHAVELHPRYVNGFLNLGLAFFKLDKEKESITYWKIAEQLYPNNPYLNNYYQVYGNMLKNRGSEAFSNGDFKTALIEYNKWTILTPNDSEAWYNRGGAAFNLGLKDMARQNWKRCLQLDPNNKEVQELIDCSWKGIKPFSIPKTEKKENNKKSC